MYKIVLFLLPWVIFQVKAQEYQVLHIKGEIERVANGVLLKMGDRVKANEEIKFRTEDAIAAVLSEEKGRYILRANKESSNQGDLIYVLKATISPVRGGMSTRAIGIRDFNELVLYFAEAPYVWAGNKINISIFSYAFPMNDSKYFSLQYSIKDEKIEKKIMFEEENLIFDKTVIFSDNGQQIDENDAENFQLYYYDSLKNKPLFITDIDFVMIDISTLEKIYNQYDDSSDDAYYDIAKMLSNIYGKCDPLQLRINLLKQ